MAETVWVELDPEELAAFCIETLPSISDDDIEARVLHVEAAAHPLYWETVPRKARDEIIGHAIATGLRVDRLERLIYAPQPKGRDWAASYDEPNRSIFAHEPFFDSDVSDRRIVMAHELGHLNSVFGPNNAWMFGGKEGQERAAETVRQIARQALSSGAYLGPYHEYFAIQLMKGNISSADFEEETWAFLCDIVATGRLDELSAVSARQAALLPKEGFVPLDITDDQAPSAFTELFTGGLIYGVHSAADLMRYATTQRASWESLRSNEANADVHYAPNFRRKLAGAALKLPRIVALR